MEVESWVLLVGADAEVGGEPSAAADAGADIAAISEGVSGHDGTASRTSGEHYRMELPQPSSSLSPCGCESHCP
jgi:hypothetical protein